MTFLLYFMGGNGQKSSLNVCLSSDYPWSTGLLPKSTKLLVEKAIFKHTVSTNILLKTLKNDVFVRFINLHGQKSFSDSISITGVPQE